MKVMKNDDKRQTRGKLDEAAIHQHEVFISWVRAGFTEDQALKLLCTQMTAAIMNQKEED